MSQTSRSTRKCRKSLGFSNDLIQVRVLRLIPLRAGHSRAPFVPRLGSRIWVQRHAGGLRAKAASNAAAFGVKSNLRTKVQDSVAPCRRSIRPSSHSTERGPR